MACILTISGDVPIIPAAGAAGGNGGAYDLSLILPPTYSRFVAAANAVNITPYTLPPIFTLFAPINSAFEVNDRSAGLSNTKHPGYLITPSIHIIFL